MMRIRPHGGSDDTDELLEGSLWTCKSVVGLFAANIKLCFWCSGDMAATPTEGKGAAGCPGRRPGAWPNPRLGHPVLKCTRTHRLPIFRVVCNASPCLLGNGRILYLANHWVSAVDESTKAKQTTSHVANIDKAQNLFIQGTACIALLA
eukprot:1148851-Pelagomonas_calceolata.AAC.2